MANPPSDDQEDPREALERIPSNLEMEQALLGMLLYDSALVDRMTDRMSPAAFHEPFHGALFEAIVESHRAGLTADVLSIQGEVRHWPAFNNLGGVRYLADLVDRSPPVSNLETYTTALLELQARRELIRLGEAMAKRAREEMKSGPILEDLEREMLSVQIGGSRRADLISISTAADAVLSYLDNPQTVVGASTGLPPLDRQLGPLVPDGLYLCAARPSMGKTAFSLSVATGVADPALQAAMNALEVPFGAKAKGVIELHGEVTFGGNDGGQAVRRHIADIGHAFFGEDFPNYRDLRDRRVSADQRRMIQEVVERLRSVPIFGVKRTGLTIPSLRSVVRRQMAYWDRLGIELGLIVVDHVGLLRADRPGSRYEQQTQIAIDLKELADELKVPILALVQLSRETERRDDKRPMLSDLRDSGGWEENADVVMALYRDAYYAQREKEPDGAGLEYSAWDKRRKSKSLDVIMLKNREGESGNSVELWANVAWNACRGAAPEILDLGVNRRIDFSASRADQ